MFGTKKGLLSDLAPRLAVFFFRTSVAYIFQNVKVTKNDEKTSHAKP